MPRNGRPFVSLRPAARFSFVYRTGTSARSGGIRVIRAAGSPGPPQVGVVASRSVGNAVERNRAKRRIREALTNVELQQNTAYVVIASRATLDVEFDRLGRWIAEAVSAATERSIDE